jgi:thiol-disulfide isomerase/thioredoxin
MKASSGLYKFRMKIINKMRPIFFIAYILFTLYSCTSRGAADIKESAADSSATENDGGKKKKQAAEEEGMIVLQPFSIKDYQKEITYSKARDIKLQKIGLEDLKKITAMSGYTWIVVWASWCPHCREGLQHYPATAAQVKTMEDMNMILVAEDYNLPQIQDRLYEIGYKKQAYVLDPEEFGMDEEMKISKLRKYLCPTCTEQEAVVPQHYLFNKDGQIVYDQVGGDVTDINIMTAIHSK